MLRLYRIVHAESLEALDLEDFKSDAEKGKPPRPIQQRIPAHYTGISLWDSIEAASSTARAFPKLGMRLAELLISDDDLLSGVISERVPHGEDGHYTLEAEGGAETFLARARSVRPIDV